MSKHNSEDLKKLVIESLPQECREIGSNFFSCLEDTSNQAQISNLNEKQFETFMTETAVPQCLKEFNLEECLAKNQN